MDGIESPVTGVAPKSDSPKVSRVRVFKDASDSHFEDIMPSRGMSVSVNPTIGYQAFSVDEEGNPIGHAEAEVEGASIRTVWQPHHIDSIDPDKKFEDLTPYEFRLQNDKHFKETGQAPLFYTEHVPATLTSLFSTSKNSSGLPSYLLGAIGKQFSGGVTYDEALTPYSAKIVHRAGKLGIVKENPHFPLKDVEEFAKSKEGVTPYFRESHDRSLINKLRDENNEEEIEDYEDVDNDELTHALNSHFYNIKHIVPELPEDEVNELPNVVKDAIKTSKAEKAAAVAQPAVAAKEKEDNTQDVPLPGFEEK